MESRCTASKKGRKDSATQTKPVAECVRDKVCKPNTDWKFLRAAKPACAPDRGAGTSPRPLPSDSCFPSQLLSGRDTQARTAGSNNSDESLILSACGVEIVEWVWVRGPSGRELRVLSTGRRRRQAPNFFFLRQPSSQPGSTACRTPSALYSSRPCPLLSAPLSPNLT